MISANSWYLTDEHDNRRAARRRLSARAKIRAGPDAALLDCILCDVSDTGCKIRVVSEHPIPDRVQLINAKTGAAWDMKVMWRRPPFLGLFCMAPAEAFEVHPPAVPFQPEPAAPSPPAWEGSDRRAAPRTRVLRSGKLAYGRDLFTVDCAVCDVSAGGARIRLPVGYLITDDCYLVELTSGVAHQATVTWRSGAFAGLRFVQEHDLAHPGSPHARILRRLWIDGSPR